MVADVVIESFNDAALKEATAHEVAGEIFYKPRSCFFVRGEVQFRGRVAKAIKESVRPSVRHYLEVHSRTMRRTRGMLIADVPASTRNRPSGSC